MKTTKKQNNGVALPTVMGVLVVLLIVGVGLLTLGLHGRTFTIRTNSEISARCAADAGLTKAVSEMNQLLKTKAWGDRSRPLSIADVNLPHTMDASLASTENTYSYYVTPKNELGTWEFVITSIGKSGGVQKVVTATIAVKSIFESAILVKNRISLQPNSLVDGYDSADPCNTDVAIKIGTTSTLEGRIPLGPGTVVNGDIFVGAGGDPATVIGAGGTVNGFKYALGCEPEFPEVTPPPLPNMGTALFAQDGPLTIGPADSGVYTDITLHNESTPGVLEITGGHVDLHITGNIDLGNSCEIIVREGSSLAIYLDGNLYADNSMGINNEAGNVKDFGLYATGTEQIFNLKAKSSIFGTVYAPDVNITMYAKTDMYGALVGNDVEFKSGSRFFWDKALSDATVYDELVHFVVERWSEQAESGQ